MKSALGITHLALQVVKTRPMNCTIMRPSAIALARRTSSSAVPFVDALVLEYVEIARGLREGDSPVALMALCRANERLERFLHFLYVASDVVAGSSVPSRNLVHKYRVRVLEIVDRMEAILEQMDFDGLAFLIERGIADTLRQYKSLANEVEWALGDRVQAQAA